MSGIYGLIAVDGRPLEPAWVDRMREDMQHRGPDGGGLWRSEGAALGHLLLQVAPESTGDTSPGRYKYFVVTADARLDDRESLLNRLGVPPADGAALTDSLLIARAFERWGKNCTDYLLGDFAFALWDEREKSLFCARDHAGARPLFYAFRHGVFAFASDIRPLSELPFVEPVFNRDKLTDYLLTLLWSGEHVEETFFRHIRRLMPARRLFLRGAQWHIEQYWRPEHRTTLRLRSDADYAEALRELLEQAVRDRLRTGYPVGVTLSGGLDSSTVACLAARGLAQQGRPLHAVSSVLPRGSRGPARDERLYIEAVAAQEQNLTLDYVDSRGTGFAAGLDQVFARTCAPVNIFHYMDDALDRRLAETRQVRLVLSGLLGDITVSNWGRNSPAHLLRTLKFGRLARLLRNRKQATGKNYLCLVKSEVLRPFAPDSWLAFWRTLQGVPANRADDEFFLNPSFLSPAAARKTYRAFAAMPGPRWNVYTGLWDSRANSIDEETGARQAYHRLEYTYPLADKRVIGFLFSLPPEQFMQGGRLRGLLRGAMNGILPLSVGRRSDKGWFSPDYDAILVRDLPVITKQIDAIAHDFFLKSVFDFKKIEKITTRLHNSEIDRILVDDSTIVLGITLMAIFFSGWFNANVNSI